MTVQRNSYSTALWAYGACRCNLTHLEYKGWKSMGMAAKLSYFTLDSETKDVYHPCNLHREMHRCTDEANITKAEF